MCVPMVKYEMLKLAAKCGLTNVREGLSVIRDSVWSCFVQKVYVIRPNTAITTARSSLVYSAIANCCASGYASDIGNERVSRKL